jgi:hypothetical protein
VFVFEICKCAQDKTYFSGSDEIKKKKKNGEVQTRNYIGKQLLQINHLFFIRLKRLEVFLQL